jgi:hypothetical protein
MSGIYVTEHDSDRLTVSREENFLLSLAGLKNTSAKKSVAPASGAWFVKDLFCDSYFAGSENRSCVTRSGHWCVDAGLDRMQADTSFVGV